MSFLHKCQTQLYPMPTIHFARYFTNVWFEEGINIENCCNFTTWREKNEFYAATMPFIWHYFLFFEICFSKPNILWNTREIFYRLWYWRMLCYKTNNALWGVSWKLGALTSIYDLYCTIVPDLSWLRFQNHTYYARRKS